MAVRSFHDFVLMAEDVETDGVKVTAFTVRVFDSPVGQGARKEKVQVPADLSRQLRQLEERKLDGDLAEQIAVGEVLAGLLFPTQARNLLGQSIARLREEEGLRLILRLDPRLADFPWEYVYLSSGPRDAAGFIALDPRISIVRWEALDTEADWVPVTGDWSEAPPRRRVLVAMATPGPHDRYPLLDNLPREQAAIQGALKGSGAIDALLVPSYPETSGGSLPGITIVELDRALLERVDVFHFSGHGEFAGGAADSQAGLVFADEANQAVLVPGDQLGARLRGKGVRLAVLGACQTGRRDGRNVWNGVAAQLLRAGIPAVVAMQFTIRDGRAAEFCAAFYLALVAGLTVDEAVSLGRTKIRFAPTAPGDKPDLRDWGVPVLYSRAPGGRTFNPVANADAARNAAIKSEATFKQAVRSLAESARLIGPVVEGMTSESVRIEQKVEESRGLVVGPTFVDVQGGKISVEQELGDVYGDVIGSKITFRGKRPSDAPSPDPARSASTSSTPSSVSDRRSEAVGSPAATIDIPTKLVERAAAFTGRTWLLNLVLDWAERGKERFLIIQGQPGSGKSSCAAWLCGAGPPPRLDEDRQKLERIRRLWSAAHFCDTTEGESLNPGTFASMLSEQLAARIPDYGPPFSAQYGIHVEQDMRDVYGGNQTALALSNNTFGSVPEDAFQKAVPLPLAKVAKHHPDLKVFILVDSLDEANTFQAPNIVDVLARPSNTAPNVRFLVTARDDDKITGRFKSNARIIDLSRGEWRASTDADIRNYVNTRLDAPAIAPRLPANADKQAISQKLVNAADGNFLYISFLLDEVASGSRDLADVDSLPGGLFPLYRAYLDRIMPERSVAGPSPRSDLMVRALCLLCAAFAPIPPAILASWLGLEADETIRTLQDLSQMVGLNRDCYRPYHRSLLDFLECDRYRDHGAEISNTYHYSMAGQHKRIATFYLSRYRDNWKDCDDYGLRYVSAHLRELASDDSYRQELYGLIARPVMDAKFEKTKSHQTFGGDVAIALEAAEAERRPNLRQIIKCSLVAAEIGSRARSVPADALAAMASVGRVQEAIDRAKLIPAEEQRSFSTTAVAQVLLTTGDSERALALLEPIVRQGGAERVVEPARLALIAAMVRQKSFDGARSVAQETAPGRLREAAEECLTRELIDAGEYDLAEKRLPEIVEYRRAELARSLLAARSENGDPAGALQMAVRLAPYEGGGELPARVLAIADRKQGFEQALALAQAQGVSAAALSRWANQLQKADRFDCAVAAKRVAGDPGSIDSALQSWAEKLVASGSFDEALGKAGEVTNEYMRAQSLKSIALSAARADRFQDGLTAMSRIENASSRRAGIAEVLRIQSDRQGVEAGLESGLAVTPPEDRDEAVVLLGISFYESGPLDLARDVAGRLPGELRRQVVSRWMRSAAAAGRFDDAWAEALPDFPALRYDMSRVLEQAIAAAQFDLALKLVTSLPAGFERNSLLATAIGYQLEHEPIGALICRIDEKDRMSTLTSLVASLVHAHNFERALDVACAIPVRSTRDIELGQLVARCIEARRLDMAIRVARAMEDVDLRAAELTGVARRLAANGECEQARALVAEALPDLEGATNIDARVAALSAAAQVGSLCDSISEAEPWIAQARQLIPELSQWYPGDRARIEFTRALALAGHSGDALQFASGITAPWNRGASLAGAVEGMARCASPELESAVATAMESLRAAQRYESADPLLVLLGALASAGRFDLVSGALAITEPHQQQDALQRAFWARFDRQDLDGALRLAGFLPAWPVRADFLTNVAGELASRGQFAEMARVGNQVIALASGQQENHWILTRLAEAAALAHQFDLIRAAVETAPESHKNSVIQSVIPVLIRSGRDSEALGLLSSFPGLTAVASGLRTSMVKLASKGAIERAAAIAKELAPHPAVKDGSSAIWQELVVAAGKGGHLGPVLAQLSSSVDPVAGEQIVRSAAWTLSADSTELAAALFTSLPADSQNDVTGSKVVEKFSRAGKYERAIAIGNSIYGEFSRIRALAQILRDAWNQGGDESVRRLAGAISDVETRSLALLDLAGAFVESGDFASAENVGMQVELTARANPGFEAMARKLAAAGQFERALRLADRVTNDRRPAGLKMDIAAMAASGGRLDLAVGIVRGLSDGSPKAWGFARLALALSSKGDFDNAARLIAEIDQPGEENRVRGALARDAARAGDSTRAEQLVAMVLGSAETGDAEVFYAGPLGDVAVALAKCGRPELATRMAGEIPPESGFRSGSLLAIADAWKKADNRERAVEATLDAWRSMLGAMKGGAQSVVGLSAQIATKLLRCEAFDQLAGLVNEVGSTLSPADRFLITAAMASRIANAAAAKGPDGAIRDRLQWKWKQWNLRRRAQILAESAYQDSASLGPEDRGRVLFWLASGYSASRSTRLLGQITREALDVARQISDPEQRGWVECNLASAWQAIDKTQAGSLFARAVEQAEAERVAPNALYQMLPESNEASLVDRAVALLQTRDEATHIRLLSGLVRGLARTPLKDRTLTLARRLLELCNLPQKLYSPDARPHMRWAIDAIAATQDPDLMQALIQRIREIKDMRDRARLGANAALALAASWRNPIVGSLLNDAILWQEHEPDPQAKTTNFIQLVNAFAAAEQCPRANEIFLTAIKAARLVNGPAVVKAVAAAVPCLQPSDTLEKVCSDLLESRQWFLRPRSA